MQTRTRSYRSVTRRCERRVERAAWREPWREVWRDTYDETWRRVLPSDGMTLGKICTLINAYYRMAIRYEKKWNPPSRYKTCAPPAGETRSFQADLERIYGAGARASETTAAPSGSSP